MMETAERKHPNYTALWGVLLLLLLVGLAAAYVGHRWLSTGLIFGVAVLKAYIVAANYMHLKHEPRYLKIAVLAALLCAGIFFVALIPDIVYGIRG